MAEPLSPLAADLRRHDRDRYQTALFAPADRRVALFALYEFNYEIARIREIIREPMMGMSCACKGGATRWARFTPSSGRGITRWSSRWRNRFARITRRM